MEKNKIQPEQSIFSLKRKPITSSYNGYTEARRYLKRPSIYGERGNTRDLSTFTNGSVLDPYFKNPGSRLKDCIELSNTLYSTNRIYQELIDFLANTFYCRYVTTPRRIKKVEMANYNKEKYMKIYHRMVEIVDGFNVETIFPAILTELFKSGQVFLYAIGDSTSKSLNVIILPNEYCQASVETQYGTTQVMFNFQFFDTLAATEEERNLVFTLFPEEFKTLYEESKKNNFSRWQMLNPKFSTAIRMNNLGFPTFLSVFYDLIDYKIYKMNELDRNTNLLEKLVTQEIDLEKTGLELPEVEVLHDSIAEIVDGFGTKTVTSVGKLDVKRLQEDVGQENKALTNALKTIYEGAGFNPEIFIGDSADSVKASLKKIMSFVYKYIEQLVNFYNLAANNVYNFSDYQLSFRVLPISPFDEKEKLEIYRANASLGVGVVDLIVASGIKQVDLESTLELEENLDLVNRLTPLQSSHVQSGNTSQSSTASGSEEIEEQEVQEDKNNPGVTDTDKGQDSNEE